MSDPFLLVSDPWLMLRRNYRRGRKSKRAVDVSDKSDIFEASKAGNINRIAELLKQGTDINKKQNRLWYHVCII